MKILAVSDEIDPALYDYYTPGRLSEYELIISCGDLPNNYLEFLVSMARCPLFYVRGNHDDIKDGPEGCDCIDGRMVIYRGVRILGLGGSLRYREGENMFTERQMRLRALKAAPHIYRHGGIDIFVTHAPPAGIHDLEDPAHRGFACFNGLIEKHRPQLMLHGHVHPRYDYRLKTDTMCGGTRIINACGSKSLEVTPRKG